MDLLIPSPVQTISDAQTKRAGIRLLLKREDLIHPYLSGNKWRKLKYTLKAAKGRAGIITFGGAFSNHVYSASFAAREYGLGCILYIRGERHEPLNSTLAFCHSTGAEIRYMDRTAYGNLEQLIPVIQSEYPDHVVIPEGGTHPLALPGVAEMISELDKIPDFVCTPAGTGGTLSGLVAGLKGRGEVLGFSALKGNETLNQAVEDLLGSSGFRNWRILTDYHFGGYAKVNRALVDFMNWFYAEHHVILEPVYTAKMLYGIYHLVENGFFQKGQTIMAIHTGGLQGLAGMRTKLESLRIKDDYFKQ